MPGGQVTQWLARWRAGDREALERLVPLVYDELRQVARRQLRRESPGHTLSATALVHEVYLRLLQQRQLAATDRDSFLAIAAQTMRRILVDHARARSRLKRGGDDRPVSLEPGDDVPLLSDPEVEEVLAIDVALERLAQVDERALRVVECRIFAGPHARGNRRRTWHLARNPYSEPGRRPVRGFARKLAARTWSTASQDGCVQS